MNILESFKPWKDKFGLISPYFPPASTGNGILYTAHYTIALKDNLNNISMVDAIGELDNLEDSMQLCQIQPGLLVRHPEHPDQEAPDDYIGFGTISYFVNNCFADNVLIYGETHKVKLSGLFLDPQLNLSPFLRKLLNFLFGWIKVKYNYNNVNPGTINKNSWIGRMPQVICHLEFAANKKPSLFHKLCWCISVLSSLYADKNDQDSYILSWHLTRVAEGKSWLCDKVINYWRKKQNLRWPNGISQVLASYFNNPNHPLVFWLEHSD